MNLIGQLGGYRAAKNWLDKNEIHVNHGYMEKYQRELLEYRRAHSIFEVGDYILPISNHSDQVHFLSEWYIENLDFRYTTKSGSWGVIIKACMVGAWRHATDLEIEAGHRL